MGICSTSCPVSSNALFSVKDNESSTYKFFQIRGKEDSKKDDKKAKAETKQTSTSGADSEEIEKNYKKKLSFRCDG